MQDTLLEYPDFEFDGSNSNEETGTKEPLWLFENYDWSEADEYEGFYEHDDSRATGLAESVINLVLVLISLLLIV